MKLVILTLKLVQHNSLSQVFYKNFLAISVNMTFILYGNMLIPVPLSPFCDSNHFYHAKEY